MAHAAASQKNIHRVAKSDRKRQERLARELTLRRAREGLFDIQTALARTKADAGYERIAMVISIESTSGIDDGGSIHASIEIDRITANRRVLGALRGAIDKALEELG